MCLAWHSQTTSTSHPSALNSSWICSCRARFRTSAFWRGHQLGGPVSSGEAGKVGCRARSAYRICRYGTDCLEDASDFPAAGREESRTVSHLSLLWSPDYAGSSSAQLFPPPGFLTANCSRSTGLTPPGDSVPVAAWKIPQFPRAAISRAMTLVSQLLGSLISCTV